MVTRHKWHVTSNGYAARNGPNRTRIYLHRVINCTPDDMFTDHRDGDRLNNTRANLRTVNPSENSQNQSKGIQPCSSQFKGVSFRPSRAVGGARGCWDAYIKFEGKKHGLGHFVTEMDAALAYNIKAREVFGEFAKLNVLPLDFLQTHPEPERFHIGAHSKFRGVSFSKGMHKWLAYFNRKGKRVHTSYHDTEQQAFEAVTAARAAIAI